MTALSVADLVRLLRAAGAPSAAEADVRAHLQRGAPTNADGSVNLVHYAAWLAKEVGRG